MRKGKKKKDSSAKHGTAYKYFCMRKTNCLCPMRPRSSDSIPTSGLSVHLSMFLLYLALYPQCDDKNDLPLSLSDPRREERQNRASHTLSARHGPGGDRRVNWGTLTSLLFGQDTFALPLAEHAPILFSVCSVFDHLGFDVPTADSFFHLDLFSAVDVGTLLLQSHWPA